jgi:hypothetical protein
MILNTNMETRYVSGFAKKRVQWLIKHSIPCPNYKPLVTKGKGNTLNLPEEYFFLSLISTVENNTQCIRTTIGRFVSHHHYESGTGVADLPETPDK